MGPEAAQLSTFQGILQVLKSHLDGAICSWGGYQPGAECHQQSAESSFGPIAFGERSISAAGPLDDLRTQDYHLPDLQDPAIGNEARWTAQWRSWLSAPTAEPADVHKTLEKLTPQEQEAFLSARRMGPPRVEKRMLVEYEYEDYFDGIARAAPRGGHPGSLDETIDGGPDIPFRPNVLAHVGHVCTHFQPGFWKRELAGRGNIWQSDASRRLSEDLSPRARPAGWGRFSAATSFSSALRQERELQVSDPMWWDGRRGSAFGSCY